ncbi:flagellar protein FliT [Dyella sp. RRB7]|uniref:flagellar protein FliT n=1 Tax=Dyella sp. RRB7 TaxID=2919502 RepID=UPI001FA97C12|nr:flagellar protein FliT [Dyella sp. RRB7]
MDAVSDLVEVSARMLGRARDGAWEHAAQDMALRDELLYALPVNDPELRETLQLLLDHNEEVRALAGHAHDQVGTQLGEQQHTRRALHTYLAAASD